MLTPTPLFIQGLDFNYCLVISQECNSSEVDIKVNIKQESSKLKRFVRLYLISGTDFLFDIIWDITIP